MSNSERGITPEEHIAMQYRKVAEAINNMFLAMRPRIARELWRVDGVGTCGISMQLSDSGIEGPAKDQILELRRKKVPDAQLNDVYHCGYHLENHGCQLDDLKSPFCLKHIDSRDELKSKFGINGAKLTHDIEFILNRILIGGTDPENQDIGIKPEVNNQFVEDALSAIQEMTRHIERFPLVEKKEIFTFTERFKGFRPAGKEKS